MSKKSVPDDEKGLLLRIGNDDQAAFKELYRRYWKECFDQVYARSGDQALAEDITQQIFVSIWEKRKRNTRVRNIQSYLHTAVRYTFINYIKRQIQHGLHARYVKDRYVETYSHVEQNIQMKELTCAIDKGVSMMPSKTREVYSLSRHEYFSVKEIAKKLNITEKTVEYHITQSLKTMRIALKDFLPPLIIIYYLCNISY